MTSSVQPPIECDQLHAGITVNNLTAAIDFYVSKLGFRKGFTWGEPPTFAGMNLGNVQIFFSEGTPTPSADTAAAFFLVGDADQLYEFHRANGVRIVEPIDDRAYSIRDYKVQDMDGYCLVFGHHLHTAGEPVKIERVEISMRLEKRLAALLEDLAKHKRMTLGNCMEEILLHTNDGAGPHTKTTLRHIEELKNKHGIDYDTHASYRFVEE
jgi:catechol 2,3-dioxygenase-like lactoylglutathione lyase family enzyme